MYYTYRGISVPLWSLSFAMQEHTKYIIDVIESLGADQLSLRNIAIELNFVKDHKLS